MVELVQATPEELDAFSKKCTTKAQLAETTVSKAITAVESVRAKWGGDFAKAYGQQWAQWQTDMKEFPRETRNTADEMARLAGIYRDADQRAKAVIGAPGGGAATAGVDPIKTAEAWSTTIGQAMDSFQKYIPKNLGLGSTGVSALLDVWASKTPEEALGSVAHTGLMTAACLTPAGLAMVIGNAGIHLGGKKAIGTVTWLGQSIANEHYDRLFLNNEKKLQEALKKIDFTKVTKSIVLNIIRTWSSEDRPNPWEVFDETVTFGFGMRDTAKGLLIHLGIGLGATGNRIGSAAKSTADAALDAFGKMGDVGHPPGFGLDSYTAPGGPHMVRPNM